MICAHVRRLVLSASLLLASAGALAASYQFPGNLPAGCSNTGGNNYSCGSLTLASTDTVTIVNKPANISFSGSLTTNGAKINAGGSAADLNLSTSGWLFTASGAVLVAQISTATLSDSGGASFTGNISTTGGGSITVGSGSTVTGNLLTTSGGGALVLGTGATVTGNATSAAGAVVAYAGSRITGNVSSSSGWVYLYDNVVVGGSATSTSGWVHLYSAASVAGNVSTGGWVYLFNDTVVGGSVSSGGSIYAYSRVAVSGSVNAVFFDNGGGIAASFGAITTTTGSLYLGVDGRANGPLTSSSGNIFVYTRGVVTGAVTTTDGIWVQAGSQISGDVSGRAIDASGIGSLFGGRLMATTGALTVGQNSTISGSVSSTSGSINLYSGVSVGGGVTCDCSFTAHGSNAISGPVWAASFTDYGSSTFGGSVASVGLASLGSSSRITGDFSSTEGWVYLNTNANVSQCTRARQSGDFITMYSGSRSGGVCCGSTCGSSCVTNFSGAATPAACSSTLPPLMAEYRFEESSYNNTAREVIDSSGFGRHGTTVGSASSTASGKICRGLSIPRNTDATIQALNTGIDVNAIGNSGTIAFWYKSVTSGTEHRMLFDASPSSAGRFFLYRDDANAGVDLNFHAKDNLAGEGNVDKLNAMSDATWTHIAVTWKVVLGLGATRLTMYVNGAQVDTQSYTSWGGALADSIGPLFFGDQSSAGYVAENQNSAYGTFDQIRIYASDLTATEIAAVYAASPSCVSLHHLEVTTPSATITEGAATTFTVKACANADCSTLYTEGLTGTLTLTGSGVTPTFITGPAFSIASGSSTATVQASAAPAGSLTVGVTGVSPTPAGDPALYCGLGAAASAGGSCTLNVASALHHVAITSASASGLTCAPNTFTITACGNADCSTPYTRGLSGTFTLAGSGLSVLFPSGAGFNIASGSSSTTVAAQVVTAGTATAGVSGLSAAPSGSPSVYCGMGTAASSGGSCGFTSATAGFQMTVAHHVAGSTADLTIAAVKASDPVGGVCLPAFANVLRPLTLKCSYSNPSSGSQPVRVGGVALNLLGLTGSACDGSGQTLSLRFNAAGVATSSVQYADAGEVTLSANYLGTLSGGDLGLQLAGSKSFIAAPYQFSVSVPGGNKIAGAAFSASVSALNYLGAVMPNFGRELLPEGVTLGWVRTQPQGSGVADGAFSGSFGSFSGGMAAASNLAWSEVGRGDLTVKLRSGGYLGSGYAMAGSSAGAPVLCAPERSVCTVPKGATATILYGANGKLTMRSGVTGSLMCDNSQFTDPNYGVVKSCWYVITSGTTDSTNGAVGRFLPHHFNLSTTPACGAFSYAGQPFGVTIEALNALGQRTVNLDGGANFSPAFAQALTLSDAGALGQGSLSGASLAASVFNKGVAAGTVSYAFTQKLTAPQTLSLRAVDADGVSSQGFAEGSMALRSGRLVMSNAFGSEKSPLVLPLRLQYWSGKSWVLSADDSCTSLPVTAVARGTPVQSNGVSASWTSSISSVSLSGGVGGVTLQPPSGGGTGSLDLALNLGTGVADLSCLGSHPATVGAGLPWLRARAGSCAATQDRDPSARATFGIFAPETRKTIHTRELF